MTDKETKITQVQITPDMIAGEREVPKLDVTKYIGKKSVIEQIETHHGIHGYFLKVLSAPVDTFNDKDVRPSRVFGLMLFEDGKIGWGSESKLAGFLKEHGVSTLDELKGKNITIQTTPANTEGEKYLTF